MAVAKHFAYNEQETDRFNQSSDVDDRTAWELYYPPFEATVEAGVASVMCSYNRVNGTHACENESLLRRDLKGRLGFRGFVMSDWWALHAPASDRGVDQEMPGIPQDDPEPWLSHNRLEASEGTSPSERHLEPALRILAAMHRLRLTERPSCTPGRGCSEALRSNQRSPQHDALAREAAASSVVLLKNSGVLPLPEAGGTSTLALIGGALSAESLWGQDPVHRMMPAKDYYMGGGSGHCGVLPEQLVTPLTALTQRAERSGWKVSASPSNNLTEALAAAQGADVAIVVVAASSIETLDRDTLTLDDGADELINALRKEGRRTIVLVQAPGTFLSPWRDTVDAVAALFLGGEQTGSAWADVVFGDRSPAGKLPIMLPKSASSTIDPSDEPSAVYSEGVFTSYRAKDAPSQSAFPFGHGLSYTVFAYGTVTRTPSEACPAPAVLCVRIDVRNAGSRSGSEVAQAYVAFPQQDDAPRLVLRGFHRTAELRPGDSEVVVFSFSARDLSVYRHGDWKLQHSVSVHIGSSSADLRGALERLVV